jgi:hypothetical protein
MESHNQFPIHHNSKLFSHNYICILCILLKFLWFSGPVFNSDVEQQIYYLKRDATQQYFASACSDKGGLEKKKRDYYLKKKPSSGILHRSKPQSVVMTSSKFLITLKTKIQKSWISIRCWKWRKWINLNFSKTDATGDVKSSQNIKWVMFFFACLLFGRLSWVNPGHYFARYTCHWHFCRQHQN